MKSFNFLFLKGEKISKGKKKYYKSNHIRNVPGEININEFNSEYFCSEYF